MTCNRCSSPVDNERANFLLECGKPVVCKSCSTEQPKVCFVDYAHKTAGSLVVVGNDPQQIRLAQRAYRRER